MPLNRERIWFVSVRLTPLMVKAMLVCPCTPLVGLMAVKPGPRCGNAPMSERVLSASFGRAGSPVLMQGDAANRCKSVALRKRGPAWMTPVPGVTPEKLPCALAKASEKATVAVAGAEALMPRPPLLARIVFLMTGFEVSPPVMA